MSLYARVILNKKFICKEEEKEMKYDLTGCLYIWDLRDKRTSELLLHFNRTIAET